VQKGKENHEVKAVHLGDVLVAYNYTHHREDVAYYPHQNRAHRHNRSLRRSREDRQTTAVDRQERFLAVCVQQAKQKPRQKDSSESPFFSFLARDH